MMVVSVAAGLMWWTNGKIGRYPLKIRVTFQITFWAVRM